MTNKQPQTMADLLAQTGYKPHPLKKSEEIEGTITSLSSKGIRIDIGAKAEGIVLEKDKRILDDLLSSLKIGDKVKATILNPESEDGFTILSLRRQRKNKGWQNAILAHDQDQIITVLVTETTRSGVLADFESLRGFIPSSQLLTSIDEGIVGENLKVKVLEAAPQENRLIFSEKAVSINRKTLEKGLSKIKLNKIYNGVVTGITKFGIFVNIGENIEGLVHISEVAWGRVEDLEKQFKIGDKVQVLVTGIDLQNLKLNLSLRQLMPDPWLEKTSKLVIDQQVQGKVGQLLRLGISVSFKDGFEGFIHKNKIPIGATLKEGDEITCLIESIDSKKRRINLIPVLKEKPVGYR